MRYLSHTPPSFSNVWAVRRNLIIASGMGIMQLSGSIKSYRRLRCTCQAPGLEFSREDKEFDHCRQNHENTCTRNKDTIYTLFTSNCSRSFLSNPGSPSSSVGGAAFLSTLPRIKKHSLVELSEWLGRRVQVR